MPWTLILTLATKLMGWYFTAHKEKKEEQKKFLEFADYLATKELISAKVKMNYKSTMDELDAKVAEANKNETPSA